MGKVIFHAEKLVKYAFEPVIDEKKPDKASNKIKVATISGNRSIRRGWS